jgi:hypothetical protein
MEVKRIKKTRGVFCQMKEELLTKVTQFEAMLDTLDIKMHEDRTNLVTLLKYVGEGIESRERRIKGQLALIAKAEMAKGQEEDKLWAQTLMTIEIININDMALEKQNHEKLIN